MSFAYQLLLLLPSLWLKALFFLHIWFYYNNTSETDGVKFLAHPVPVVFKCTAVDDRSDDSRNHNKTR